MAVAAVTRGRLYKEQSGRLPERALYGTGSGWQMPKVDFAEVGQRRVAW